MSLSAITFGKVLIRLAYLSYWKAKWSILSEEKIVQQVYKPEKPAVGRLGNSSQISKQFLELCRKGHKGWTDGFPVPLPTKCTESLLWNPWGLNQVIYWILTIWPRARNWWQKDEYDSVPALKHSQSSGKNELIKSDFKCNKEVQWCELQQLPRGRSD